MDNVSLNSWCVWVLSVPTFTGLFDASTDYQTCNTRYWSIQTEESGRLQNKELQRVRQDWVTRPTENSDKVASGSLTDSEIKNLPAMQDMQETRVQSLVQEDPLEEEMVTHPSILAWRIPWTEEAGGLQSMGSQRGGHDGAHTVWAALTSQPSSICDAINVMPP